MKKYKSSLNKYKNKLDFNDVIIIIKQLLLSIINAYFNFGFLHNDLHLSNILIENNKKSKKLTYKFQNKIIIIENNKIPIISDFDKSIIYNDEIIKDTNTFYAVLIYFVRQNK